MSCSRICITLLHRDHSAENSLYKNGIEFPYFVLYISVQAQHRKEFQKHTVTDLQGVGEIKVRTEISCWKTEFGKGQK